MPIDTPHNPEPRRSGKEGTAPSTRPRQEALTKARRLLGAGHRYSAIDVLEGYLEANPHDGDAMELLVEAHRGAAGTETGKAPDPLAAPNEVVVEELDQEPSQAELIESSGKGTDEGTTEEEVAEAPIPEAARHQPEPRREPEAARDVREDAPTQQVPTAANREAKQSELPRQPPIPWQDSSLRGRPGRALSLQGELEEATTIATLVTPAGPPGRRLRTFAIVASGVLLVLLAYILITKPWLRFASPESREITPTVEVEPSPPKNGRGSIQDPLGNPGPDTGSERSLEQTSNQHDLVEASPVPEAPGNGEGVQPDPVEDAALRRGTLILLASPWARVISIRDENHDEVDFERPAFTPFRLDLPPGWYSVTLERPESPVCTRSFQITSSAVTTTRCKFGELEPLDLLERIGS